MAVDKLSKEQATAFKGTVQERLADLCPADDSTKDTCEVDPGQSIENDGSQTCFTMTYLPDYSTMELASKRICTSQFNSDFAGAYAIQPDPDANTFSAYKERFKQAVKKLLEFKDITGKMVGEYNGAVMKLYQGATDMADEASKVEQEKFTTRTESYVVVRLAAEQGPLKEMLQKSSGKTYVEAEAEFIKGELERAKASGEKPLPQLEMKFLYAETLKGILEGK